MKCPHCPVKDIPCISEVTKLTLSCDRINPDNPLFNPGLIEGVKKVSTDLYNKENYPELIPPPSFPTKVFNFAKAMEQVGENILRGEEVIVSDHIRDNRLAICSGCSFKTEDWRCEHPSCGCDLNRKTTLASQKCPLGLWGGENNFSTFIISQGSCCGQKGTSGS
jgi:hypothetical protein